MAGLLGDLTVRFRADLSNLSAGVSRARTELSSLSSAAQHSSSGLLSGFKSAGSGLLDFGSKVGMTVFGLKNLAQGAVGLGQALLAPNASMEQTTVAFETLLGKGKATQEFLGQLEAFAAATPFEFPELATNAQHMLAFGFTAKEVIPTLTDIGDAMSAMGKSTAEIDQVVTVFGQMKAAGRVNAQDMMQLTSQGIPAWKMLAEAMHLTIPEVRDLSEKGLLPADQSIKALTSGMHKMFGGGMAEQAETFNGRLSTLSDKAGAALRAFTGPLFDQAKAGLKTLGDLVSSKQFQDFARMMGEKVGGALSTLTTFIVTQLVPGFQRLIAIGSSVVQFFRDNEAALTALKVVGIAVAGAVFAVMIAGFIAWAVAAGAAAIATLAATWPILAIGAAIALLIAGIILLVQNWGAITAFLQGVWTGFVAWFQATLAAIGAFFVGIWQGIATFFTGIWNGIVSGLQAAWNFIVVIVQQGAQMLLMLVLGPIIAIANLFIWLYNHNTYFKALVDAIISFFQGAFAWLTGAWNGFVGWLTGLWNGLVGRASALWNAISSAITGAINAVVGWLRGAWSGAIGWLSGVWNSLVGMAQGIWNAITGVFRNAWNGISGALSSIGSGIVGWISGLANQAFQWGKDLIQGFINGIINMVGAVGQAAANVASAAAAKLGFHSPAKEGPGRDADVWGPNLVKMFASGMETMIPQVRLAVGEVASVLLPLSPSSAPSAPLPRGTTLQAASLAVTSSLARGQGQGGTLVLNIDGREWARAMYAQMPTEIRLRTGVRSA
jgi:tape measure domain-containing protein